MTALPQNLDLWQATLDWQPNDRQQEQFQGLYEALLAGNQRLNLTRITEPEEFWEKHLWDSLGGVIDYLQDPMPEIEMIDIGTGGGFPGVPIAIARPHWQITLLDSTRKKITFLQQMTQELNLTNIHCLVDRVEQVGQDPQQRERYDLATLRAVAAANVCAEYALPLVKVGGEAILYRGQWTMEEEAELIRAVEKLGGDLMEVETFVTPLSEGQRTCLHLAKIKPTPPEFPRAIGIPTQKPLN
ncbi:16S rRNA (guanine(527)-N(7))-methyltransferase RsmG [Alkalinema pantanalense CENA528]|uniref:16S rRNA (guanine(527)-N(7))-methyltransferase RsmG n=1 Tax=Alkalinema pantanalense TaxID=1620705 RepID=UPI003D6DAFC5